MGTSLQLPFFLPGGESLLMDHDFVRRLHEGDATVGWVGDPRLGVYAADGRLEIWRHEEDGSLSLVMRSRPGLNILGTEALRFLAEHDTRSRRAFNPGREVREHNARADAAREQEQAARVEELADRLHHALLRDVGAHVGGSTKRVL